MVSHHPAKFVRIGTLGDIMVFVCHVTLQDHVIKALNEFMISSPSRSVTILSSLVVIDPVVVET